MTVMATDAERYLSINDVAELTGLSQDTLRWYEREGLFPPVERGSDRRRRYSPRQVALVRLLVRLRRTGMITREMRRFSELVAGGAATHGVRMALLGAHRERLIERMGELQDDLSALDDKIDHYRRLIAEGLDCDGVPIRADTAGRQPAGTAG